MKGRNIFTTLFLIVDLFCGAGGTTSGFENRKDCVVIACVNHDANAIKSHSANHPNCKHFTEDIRTLDLTELTRIVEHHRKIYPITAKPFVMATNFDNKPSSVEEPLSTITANRKWHYLVNPSWFGNPGSVDDPCCTVVARGDKAPLYMVVTETGELAIRIDEADSDIMRKIKEFMCLYGICDIKMRMLKIIELLPIQGFPKDYTLIGTQAEKKKYIGNSVHTVMPDVIAGALVNELEMVAA